MNRNNSVRFMIFMSFALVLSSCQFSCKDGKLTGFTSEDTKSYRCEGVAKKVETSCVKACEGDGTPSSERNRCECQCGCDGSCQEVD